MAMGLVDSVPQAKRITNPRQDAILPHDLMRGVRIDYPYRFRLRRSGMGVTAAGSDPLRVAASGAIN
jgi:hypothetical protein